MRCPSSLAQPTSGMNGDADVLSLVIFSTFPKSCRKTVRLPCSYPASLRSAPASISGMAVTGVLADASQILDLLTG